MNARLDAHLEAGVTTLARAWSIDRSDGVTLGFTDHDRDLAFAGIAFRAGSGLSARALEQTAGLAVDNTEALGALSDAALTEPDLAAGRYDGAGLRIWWVNWADPRARRLVFRGSLGEVSRAGIAFRAELRGLAEPLSRPQGRVFQATCGAVLGDAACGVDLTRPGFLAEVTIAALPAADVLHLRHLGGFDERWFDKGAVRFLSGQAAGLRGMVKSDRWAAPGLREIVLWERPGAPVAPGDMVRLTAGCDRRAVTCRVKFDNLVRFRGFPHIPGEDWLTAVPRDGGPNDGGSLRG